MALAALALVGVVDAKLVVLEPVHRVIQHTSAMFGYPKYGSSGTPASAASAAAASLPRVSRLLNATSACL